MITVEVKFHSILRHRPDGQMRRQVTLQLAENATVADILAELEIPKLTLVVMVNDRQADRFTMLSDGARVDLIPAVSGG